MDDIQLEVKQKIFELKSKLASITSEYDANIVMGVFSGYYIWNTILGSYSKQQFLASLISEYDANIAMGVFSGYYIRNTLLGSYSKQQFLDEMERQWTFYENHLKEKDNA